jgi:deoxyribodipyrimidine photolyase
MTTAIWWIRRDLRLSDNQTFWTMPLEIQRQNGCLIGQDYPTPMVDHPAKEQVLALYQQAREGQR